MPLNSNDEYFSNPKVGERHGSYDKHGQKSQKGHVEENGADKGPMEMHKLPDGYKTVAQNDDGSIDERDHPDIHTAVHHMMSHFGEERPEASDQLEPDEDDLNPGQVESSDSGAY